MSDLSKMSNEDLVNQIRRKPSQLMHLHDHDEVWKELLRRLNRKPKRLEWRPWTERFGRMHSTTCSAMGVRHVYDVDREEDDGEFRMLVSPVLGGIPIPLRAKNIEYAQAFAQAHNEAELAKWFEESPNA